MRASTALKAVFIISILGLLFSGYLSYTELFQRYCALTSLGLGSCTNVLSIPACVYGFVMYLAIFILSLLGLRSSKK